MIFPLRCLVVNYLMSSKELLSVSVAKPADVGAKSNVWTDPEFRVVMVMRLTLVMLPAEARLSIFRLPGYSVLTLPSGFNL
jgi:hypothetical protein